MAGLFNQKRLGLRQPSHALRLRNRYAAEGAYVAAANNLLAGFPRLAPNGTVSLPTGAGGLALATNGATGSYWDTGTKPKYFTVGAATWVAQFSISGSSQGLLASEVDNSTQYIEELWINSVGQSANAGSLEFLARSSANSNLVDASTGNIGINDGLVHTVVWRNLTATTVDCWIDGMQKSVSYSQQATLINSNGNLQYPIWLLTRNVRLSPAIGSGGANLFLYARLPYLLGNPAEVSSNPWVMFEPVNRRIYFGAAAAGGDLSTGLTGSSATFSAGSLKSNIDVALSGSSATASSGSVAASVLQALSGSSTTVTAGTVKSSVIQALSGSSVTSSSGNLTASVLQALSGSSATVSAGNLTSSIAYALNGELASFAAGTLQTSGNVQRALSGTGFTATTGSLQAQVSYSLSGTSATIAQGSLTQEVSAALSGLGISFQQGTVTAVGGEAAPVATKQSGGGKSRGHKKRIVEIDGHQFAVSSVQEAQELLSEARRLFEERTSRAIEQSTRTKRRAKRKVLADARRSINLPVVRVPEADIDPEASAIEQSVREFMASLEKIRADALQSVEIGALIRRQALADDEDAIAILLMSL